MNQERLSHILSSGIWGTCGPMEDLAAKKLCEKLSKDQPLFAVLTYSYAAAEEILDVAKRMALCSEKNPVTLRDFGFAGAILTPDESLYEITVDTAQCFKLIIGFNTFGNYFKIHHMRERDDRFHVFL